MEDVNQNDDPDELYPWYKIEPYTQKDENGTYRLLGERTNLEAVLTGLESRVFIHTLLGSLIALALNFIWAFNPIWLPLGCIGLIVGWQLYLSYRFDLPLDDRFYYAIFNILMLAVMPLVFLLSLQYLRTLFDSLILRGIVFCMCMLVTGNSYILILSLPLDNWTQTKRFTEALYHDWYIGINSSPGTVAKLLLYFEIINNLLTTIITICLVAAAYCFKRLWKIGQLVVPYVPTIYRNLLFSKLAEKLPDRTATSSSLASEQVYKPIRTDRGIRLIELPKWRPFQATEIDLLHVNLDDAPPYEAISYCWGNAAKSHEVVVNGRAMRIPEATYNVLRGRRSSKRNRRLWIDAICIDQSNTEEKGHQVQMMRDIYAKADRVVVCLKGSALSAVLSLSLLQEILVYVKTHKLSGEQILANCRVERFGIRWRCLEQLLSQDLFFRVWVVQEVAAASVVDVVCGGVYIDFDLLREFSGLVSLEPSLGALLKLGPGGVSCHHAMSNLALKARIGKLLPKIPIYQAFKMAAMGREPDLVETAVLEKFAAVESLDLDAILVETDMFKATDPRDKIYSLFGLALNYPSVSDKSDDALVRRLFIQTPITVDLTPDYSRITVDLYMDVARHFLAGADPFPCLGRAGIGYKTSIKGLPSWAPDWTRPRDCALLTLPMTICTTSQQYAAGGRTEHRIMCLKDENSDISIIAAVGLSSIRAIGRVYPPTDPVDEDLLSVNGKYSNVGVSLRLHDWHEEALKLAQQYVRGLPIDTFWKALCGERSPTRERAPETFAQDYVDWVSLLKFVKKDHDSALGSHKDFFQGSRDVVAASSNLVSPNENIWHQINALHSSGTAVSALCAGRRFFVTTDGHVGLAPSGSKVGDQVFVFSGGKTPCVLRKLAGEDLERFKARHPQAERSFHGAAPRRFDSKDDSDDTETTETDDWGLWQLVGECYLNGFMNGEAFETADVHMQLVGLV